MLDGLSCVCKRDVSARAFHVFGVPRTATRKVITQDVVHTGLQYAANMCWPQICSELIDPGGDVTAADSVIEWFR